MVINTNNGFNSANQTSNTRERAGVENNPAEKQAAKPQANNPNASDKVVLSPEAKAFGKLSSAVNKAPEVDSEKVANIKKAISEGKFEVNAERIAEKMLQQENLFG